MLLNTTDEYEDRIRSYYIEEQWLKCYNLTLEYLYKIEVENYITNERLNFCYTSLSTSTRRLGQSELALEYANKALDYATNEIQEIKARNSKAICYIELDQPDEAIIQYNKNIEICDSYLKIFSMPSSREHLLLLENKADLIHNKGDLLNDTELINDSITLYSKLLIMNGTNKQRIKNKIAKAIDNLDRIHINNNMLSTPLMVVI